MSKIVGLIIIIIGVIDFFTGIIGCYYWELLYLDNWVPRPFGKCQPLPYLIFTGIAFFIAKIIKIFFKKNIVYTNFYIHAFIVGFILRIILLVLLK